MSPQKDELCRLSIVLVLMTRDTLETLETHNYQHIGDSLLNLILTRGNVLRNMIGFTCERMLKLRLTAQRGSSIMASRDVCVK